MAAAGPFLAIDFGTSNSSMAWYNTASGRAEIILNAEQEDRTPSVVYYGDTETLVGEPALRVLDDLRHIEDEQEREREGSRLIRSIKRHLAGEYSLALPDGREVAPVDVAAKIIGKLKDDAETGHFHEEVKRVVLTCPAEFGEMERELLERAARQAGFEEVALLEEPEAAAIAYASAGLKVGNGVLVYDLGGGTFDLALVRRTADGRYERAMEAMGDAHCGGDDFDQALYEHWEEEVRREHGRGLGASDYQADPYLLAEARRRKEDLTDRDAVRPFAAPLPGGRTVKLAIDRPTFETLIAPRVDRTVEKAAHMYREAKERGQEVDTVVLIGGASLIPLIKRRLSETLPVDPKKWQYQHVAVALGAAYKGAQVWQARSEAPEDTVEYPRRAMDGDVEPKLRFTSRHVSGEGADVNRADELIKIATLLRWRSGHHQTKRNVKDLLNWLHRTAARGDARAQYQLGTLYYTGHWDVSKDYGLAHEWYSKAADQGVKRAKLQLGLMSRRGQGCRQDFDEAFSRLREALGPGSNCLDSDTYYQIGLMYRHGLGVSQSFSDAALCFTQAAEAKEYQNQYALLSLGVMYKHGCGVPRDEVASDNWFHVANDPSWSYYDRDRRELVPLVPLWQQVIDDTIKESAQEIAKRIILRQESRIDSEEKANGLQEDDLYLLDHIWRLAGLGPLNSQEWVRAAGKVTSFVSWFSFKTWLSMRLKSLGIA